MSQVFHNWGRWVAHCDSLNCVSAALVEVGQETFACQCRDTQICQHGPICGTVTFLSWPADPEGVETVLAPRALANRHWYPHESIEDLKLENEVHEV